jgi:hypothetical protein
LEDAIKTELKRIGGSMHADVLAVIEPFALACPPQVVHQIHAGQTPLGWQGTEVADPAAWGRAFAATAGPDAASLIGLLLAWGWTLHARPDLSRKNAPRHEAATHAARALAPFVKIGKKQGSKVGLPVLPNEFPTHSLPMSTPRLTPVSARLVSTLVVAVEAVADPSSTVTIDPNTNLAVRTPDSIPVTPAMLTEIDRLVGPLLGESAPSLR